NALQPTVLLVASDNGLYRSADGGFNWTRISGSNGLPNGNVTDVAGNVNSFKPPFGNSNSCYAAIPGQGVFRSTNAGVTWSAANANIPATVVSRSDYIELAVHDNVTGTEADYVVLFDLNATASNGLFRSTNEGGSWTAMDFPGQTE